MKDMASLFAALADPTRLRLLHLMRDGEICVCFLQAVLKTNQPKISRHLAYLRNAGLVEARKEGKWMHYSLTKQDPMRQQILTQTFKSLSQKPQAQRDFARLKAVCCCPADFGIPAPME